MTEIKPGDLQSYNQLIIQATITIADVEAAIEEWQENPPDEKYETILEAEVVEEVENE